MTNLDALRRLKRDPAAFSVTRDPSGHTFSPSLKAQQKEVDEKYKEAGALAAKAKAEFEQRYAQGFALREAGDDEAALEQFAAAYILAREINYRAGEADALNMSGVCYKHRGEFERAASVFEGCAKICASMKDPHLESAALGNLGQALAAQRRLAEAETAHERSLELARAARSGDRDGSGGGAGSSAGAAGGAARDDEHAGDKSGELSALFHLGTLRLRMQRFSEAEIALTAAQAIAVALQDKAAEVGVLQRLAAARNALEDSRQQPQPSPQQPQPSPQHQQPSPQQLHPSDSPGGAGRNRFASVEPGSMPSPPRASLPSLLPAPLKAPLPPLEGEKQPPLALLVRAEKLTREIGRGGEPLRMLVLRQLRAQYAKLRNEEGIRACEREIDALHARAQELHEAQKAEQRRRKEQIESLAVDVSAVEVSSAADADPDADEPKAKSGAAAKDEASSERPSPCRQHEQQGVIV
jgi:tetratricopeptide (TPR) repeat protein